VRIDRRCFLRAGLTGAVLSSADVAGLARARAADEKLPPVRQITRGPKFHWFGYYDKRQFDPSNRYVLGMEVDFEGRTPTVHDTIRVGMVDTKDNDRWIELGSSRAWGWQQGCMLQWIPGSTSEVIWNDRQRGRFVARVLDVHSGKTRTLPQPVYTLRPDGRTALGLDFGRLQFLRPGYGYYGVEKDHAADKAPKETGIYSMDLASGERRLLIPYADALKFPYTSDISGAWHWFNHLLFNTDGTRFIFLHRWRMKLDGPFVTRMFTTAADSTGAYVLDPSGNTSHFIWSDPKHVLAWTQPAGRKPGFYRFTDESEQIEQIGRGVMTENGHCTYLPGNRWILNDTYPDRETKQHPYLFEVATGRRVPLGHFASPVEYRGEWRCDTHPRFSPDGQSVVIDSPHNGGRQMYLIDVSGIVG
jgi:hypothetical protein